MLFKKDEATKKREFELKKAKIENNYKSLDWTKLIITFLVGFVIIIGISFVVTTWFTNVFMIALSDGFSGVSNSVSSVFETNPELMFALNDNLPDEALYLTLAKQMSVEADVDFYGYFTTKTKRSLEKVNLSCIDEYQYRTLLTADDYEPNTEKYIEKIQGIEEFKDIGCTQYHKVGNVTYFKCPLRNCELIEIQTEVLDEFIPKRLGVKKVSVVGD